MNDDTTDNEQKDVASIRTILAASGGTRKLGRVLDIGCGVGTLLKEIEPVATSIAGVDIRDEFLNVARGVLPGATVLSSDAAAGLPFAPASFDRVFLCDVIEHLREPFSMLEEAYRVLAPGGTIVLTTPNANSPIRRLRGNAWFGLKDPTHIMFYSGFTLSHVISKVGFHPERVRTLGLTMSPVANVILPRLSAGGTLLVVGRK